jgi:hypothetical protein
MVHLPGGQNHSNINLTLLPLDAETPSQGTTDCTQVTEIPQTECEALVALYNSTNGPNWSDSPDNNWNMTNEPCSWEGVDCDCVWNDEYSSCDYHVVGIRRWRKNLRGTLTNLNHLFKLRWLRLGSNKLSGSIPDLSALGNLEWLSLYRNKLSGSIPDLSALGNLEGLYLSNNQLSGAIPDLTALGNLQSVELKYNCLTASEPALIALLDGFDPGWETTQNNCSAPPEDAETPIDDTQPPTITISEPSGLVFSTEANSINIAGTAEDNVEVVQIVWTNNQGDSGEAVAMTMNDGTMTWSMDNIALQDGENIITVTAYDAAGLYGSANLTVTKVLPGSTLPTVTISSHPPTSVLSNVDSINIAGTAYFNEYQKITWENNHGNGGEVFISEMSALIDGTAIWNKDNIPLKVGENIITVTVYDAIGLQSSEEITITVSEPDFKISAVYPNTGTYNRTERVLTVWWTTTDTSRSTNVKIFLFDGNEREILSESTPDDEQETFIIRDNIQAKDWLVCISTVPMTAMNKKCASGNITIE